MDAVARMINSGRRLHLQHGPIDLIIQAWGEPRQVASAYQQAEARFKTVLTELVAELSTLRSATDVNRCNVNGAVAKRMWAAATTVAPDTFSTPMIAVAGSVADEILQAMTDALPLQKVCVNNGGDIALAHSAGQSSNIGVVTDPGSKSGQPGIPVTFVINHGDGIGGLATSGWQGRSLSTGIADAVTVLASDTATADAAATIIANAVDLPGCRAIKKLPANTVDPDSDLGNTQITTAVGALTHTQISTALHAGLSVAEQLVRAGIIVEAGLSLAGEFIATANHATMIRQSTTTEQRTPCYD